MGIDPKQLASLLQSQNQIINTGEISAGEQQLRGDGQRYVHDCR